MKVYFDITFLLDWKGPVTGIPRVLLSLSNEMVKELKDDAYDFFFYSIENENFEILDKQTCKKFLLNYGKKENLSPESLKHTSRSLSEDSELDGVLVFYGNAWDYPNLQSQLFNYKKAYPKFKVCGMVFDITPALFPETFGAGFPPVYMEYIYNQVHLADGLVFISEHSLKDFKQLAETNLLNMPSSKVIHLGFTIDHSKKTDSFFNDQHKDFVLCVGRLEGRKNQIFLVRLWAELIRKNGNVPDLLLVGRMGHRGEEIISEIKERRLENKIKWLDGISDEELSELYKNCLFTVFPSLYEGWGLPIVESLFFGKHCITSNTSSMIEASSGLADCLPPESLPMWVDKLTSYLSETNKLLEKENQIRSEFKPVTWKDSLKQHNEFWLKL